MVLLEYKVKKVWEAMDHMAFKKSESLERIQKSHRKSAIQLFSYSMKDKNK